MTQFTLNVENETRLTTLGSQVKDLTTMTKPVFVPSADGSMSVNLYSSKNAMTFKVAISDYESTDDVEGTLNYFSLVLDDFCSTVDKISNSCEDDISITVDKSTSHIIFKNIKTGARISLATYNSVVTPNDANNSIDAVDTVYNVHFRENAKSITITPEIIAFYESAQRFMVMYPAGRSNAIAVNRNKVRFGNGLTVIEKTLAKDASTYDGNVYLKKAIIDFVKPFVKAAGSIDVMLNANDDIVYVDGDTFGFKAIRSLESTSYEFPSDEDIASVSPTDDHKLVVSVNKKAILNAFGLFDGTFKNANWLWKSIRMDSSKKYLDSGVIGFEHHDRSAECETTLPVEIISNTTNADESSLIVSSQALVELLGMIPEEKFTMEYNEFPPTAANGGYIRVKSDTINALAVKIKDRGANA